MEKVSELIQVIEDKFISPIVRPFFVGLSLGIFSMWALTEPIHNLIHWLTGG